MGMIYMKKLNVIKEVDEREAEEWERKGYKSAGSVKEDAQSGLDAMTQAQLNEYAEEKGIDISKAKTKKEAIAMLEKVEQQTE